MLEVHSIPPVFDAHSQILILGSFPSVKSRETTFFYGHPQNRFWKVLSNLLKTDCPTTVEEKKTFLLSHRIALWDVIRSCEIEGSSDASIKNVVPNDLTEILKRSEIKAIFTNGKTANALYRKYILPEVGRPAIGLPSTSPANAAKNLVNLCNEWHKILDFLPQTRPNAQTLKKG